MDNQIITSTHNKKESEKIVRLSDELSKNSYNYTLVLRGWRSLIYGKHTQQI